MHPTLTAAQIFYLALLCPTCGAFSVRDSPADHPAVLVVYSYLALFNSLWLTVVVVRFTYFLRVQVGTMSEREDGTICGLYCTRVGGCFIPAHWLAWLVIVLTWLSNIFAMVRTNAAFKFMFSPTSCRVIFGLYQVFDTHSTMLWCWFLYARLVTTFRQSALKMTQRANIACGFMILFFIAVGVVYYAGFVAPTGELAPVNGGGEFCSSQFGRRYILFTLFLGTLAFIVQSILLIGFVFRINAVNDMSDQHDDSSRTASTKVSIENKQKQSQNTHFMKLAVKITVLTAIVLVLSFAMFGIIGSMRVFGIFFPLTAGTLNALAGWMSFHEYWAEYTYKTLCGPCDRCCLNHYNLLACCVNNSCRLFEMAEDTAAHVIETVASIHSIGSFMGSQGSLADGAESDADVDIGPMSHRGETERSQGDELAIRGDMAGELAQVASI